MKYYDHGLDYNDICGDESWLEKWIEFKWLKSGIVTNDIDYDHVADMMRKGFTSGELIRETEKETVKGWWEKRS